MEGEKAAGDERDAGTADAALRILACLPPSALLPHSSRLEKMLDEGFQAAKSNGGEGGAHAAENFALRRAAHRGESSIAESGDVRTANSALRILELLPRSSLVPHLERLRTIAGGASGTDEVLAAKLERMRLGPLDDVRGAVLGNASLLARILDAEGSLALREKNYDLLVGLDCPRPHGGDPNSKPPGYLDSLGVLLKRVPGRGSNALVSKSWHSLVLGKGGLGLWGEQLEANRQKEMRIARETKDDETVSWSARLCAMAICNDAEGLRDACERLEDQSQGIGAAIKEQERIFWGEGDFEEVPACHPFAPYCNTGFVDDDDDFVHRFVLSIALAAALVGSTDSVRFIEARFFNERWPLCVVPFDQRGALLVHHLVEYACAYPPLDGPVRSVRAVLPRHLDEEDFALLHSRHYGGIGNPLHRAAARGHRELVEALLDGGLNPSKRCGRIGASAPLPDWLGEDEFRDERNEGRKELPLPEHWAEVRGHARVAQILGNGRNRFRPYQRDAFPHACRYPQSGQDVKSNVSFLEAASGNQNSQNVKSKGATRREKQRLAKEQAEREVAEAKERKREEEMAKAAANASDPEKRAKKIKKLLKQIAGIKSKAASGVELNDDQNKKLSTESELRDELAKLGL